MTTQTELFQSSQSGNVHFETPMVVGRVTQLTESGVDQFIEHVKEAWTTDHIPGVGEKVGRMHSGNLSTSARLQATLAVLSDHQWHTTRDIRLVTDSEAVHSDMAGLAANGILYDCEPCGGKKYRYRLKQ